MKFLAGDTRPQPWAARFGWDRGMTHRVFSGKQLPSPEALTQLAIAERVNLIWLLTGDGEPYAVFPIPDPATLKERRTRDDPAGRRRDCVGDRNRQPTGDAIPPRAARPAA